MMVRRDRNAISAAVALAAIAALSSVPLARAERQEAAPSELEGVGVDERLDEAIPLDLEFADESGETVRLGDYFDGERPVILTLNYYECPMLCTLELNGLAEALRGMDWVPGREFEIVTVSIDPRETPALARDKKATYLKAYGRPEAAEGWHFLTGREQSIRALADAVGFRYSYIEQQGQWAHAAVLFLATPDGRLSRYLYGVQFDPKTLRLSLVEASRGGIGSTLDRLILYCYHYDSEAGTYAPQALRIMQLGGLATVVVLGGLLLVFWRREASRRGKA